METESSKKRRNRRQRKDSHVHSHRISKWITPENITSDVINHAHMTVTKIHCYKNCWTISGKIWGDIDITLRSDGEYRSELMYDRDKPFIIEECADWSSAELSTPEGKKFTVG